MNYVQTVDFLFSQLPMYQRVGPAAYKKDLGNTVALCKALNNPHTTFKSIHVAGTNGKGSCSHMLASVFQQHGYKTGLYTSPHLIDFRERIRINGIQVSEQFVIDFVQRISPLLDKIKPSFFEITVAMAFAYFAKEDVDIAIIETGLGGRLDSTNVIRPELSLITNIGLDHTDMLGTTLQEIAREKGGIMKPHVPVVIGEHHTETYPVFQNIASNVQAPLFYAKDLVTMDDVPPTDLLGHYQRINVHSVMGALNQLTTSWNLNQKDIELGLTQVAKNTGMKGRWQIIQHSPKVICDTGHNVEGLTALIKQLNEEDFDQLHIVFGQVTGKNPMDVLKLLPITAQYYFCQPDVIRGLDVNELGLLADQAGLTGSKHTTVEEAYRAALDSAQTNDVVFVGGSTFVVADLLRTIESQP